jgi:hypothetical protein
MKQKTTKAKQERLAILSFYITKYSDLWNKSPRLSNWVHEYNTLKDSISYEDWKAYCEKHQYDPAHNGYDCLA